MKITVDDGVQLDVVTAGSPSDPGLLLVHGFGGAKDDFADHLDALATDHRVVSFDHRGHALSDAPDDPHAYSLDRLASDTLAVAEALELHDVRLLGHSMGGMVTRRLALRRPDRFAALVFMDTSPGPPPGLDPELVAFGVEVVHAQGMDELKRLQDELDPLGSPSYERVLAERPGFREYCEWKWKSLSPAMWTAIAPEIVNQPDQTDDLRALAHPSLVLVGSEDLTFLRASEAIAAALPHAQLGVIPDAGHSPQFENPPVWYQALRQFLDSL
jgi:3-oxoadipate enol-lactonase